MSDTIVKRVRTVFDADMSAMQSALGRSGAKALEAQQKVSGLQNAFAGLGKYVAGVVGFVALKNLVQFTSGLESMRLSMGVLLQAGDKMRGVMTPFAASMKEAEGAMTLLRQAAVDTPATTKQVADAFNVLALKARAAGMATKELVALSANVATVDQMMGGQGVVARDIDQLLRGEGADVATAQLAPLRKELAALGKAGKHAEALKKISGALALDEDVKAAFGASAEGMFATLTDQWEMFKAEVGKPILKELMKAMKELLRWVKDNQKAIADFAKFVGDAVVAAMKLASVISAMVGGALKLANEILSSWPNIIGTAAAAMALFGGSIKTAVLTAFAAIGRHPVFMALFAAGGLVAGLDKFFSKSDATKANEEWATFVYARDRAEEVRRDSGSTAFEAGSEGAFWDGMAQQALGRWSRIDGSEKKDAFLEDWKRSRELAGPGFSRDDLYAVESNMARERDGLAEQFERANILAKQMNAQQDALAKQGQLPQAYKTNEFGIREAIKGAMEGIYFTVDPKTAQLVANSVTVNQDNRGSKVTVNQRIDTNDPSRLAGATLVGAFVGAFARPLSARVGLGGIAIGNN